MATGPGARSPATGRLVESERAALPRVVGRPHALVRSLLAQPYTGIAPETARHRLLLSATARVSLVVKIDDSPNRPPGFVQGAHDRYALVDGECARSYVEVGMAPLGAYRLLGRPIDELGDAVVDLQDVFGAPGRRLVELIRDEPTWRGRFAVLDRFLLNAAERGPEPSAEVAWAWRRIVESRGHDGDRARREGGRLESQAPHHEVRPAGRAHTEEGRSAGALRALLAHVTTDRTTPWPVAAAEAGYADQAHMIRDFRAFTGVTPTEYVARRGDEIRSRPRSSALVASPSCRPRSATTRLREQRRRTTSATSSTTRRTSFSGRRRIRTWPPPSARRPDGAGGSRPRGGVTRCSVAGRSHGGIVADMTGMHAVHDVRDDRVTVGAGATWREVLAATLPFGRFPPAVPDYLDLSVGGTLAVGGVGARISAFGAQTDNVVELQVVTGDGEEVTCSADRRADLFDAVRAGLGQVAVVTRATLTLVPAPGQVRRLLLFYPDLPTMLHDQRLLVADGRFDAVQGAVLPAPAVAGRSASTPWWTVRRARRTTPHFSTACPPTAP